MAQADWTESTNSLSQATLDRGVTAGAARPPGGGSFVYGFNSLALVNGGCTLFSNLVNFAPMAKGGSLRVAMKRGLSGGPTNFSPFLFLCAQGPDISDNAYLLGLSDEEPSRIVLRKGRLVDGVPAGLPGTLGILGRSTATFPIDTWLHLRLDVIVNTNGDVALNCFRSDLTANGVTVNNPVWAPIAGLSNPFIDDALAVNSGSAAFTGGRAGFGVAVKDINRRAYFDQIELQRQLLATL